MDMSELIIIADDHPVFRDGMCRLIASLLPNATLLEAGTMDEVHQMIADHGHPDLFLLDLLFPGMQPRETLKTLRQQCSKSSIMIVSMLDDDRTIDRIMNEGADGFIVKSIPAQDMIDAIMAVRAGKYVVAKPNIEALTDAVPTSANVVDLTRRQIEILQLISAGKSTKLIARTLGLSPFTVRNHISLLLRTWNVNSRSELAAKAKSLGCLGAEGFSSEPSPIPPALIQ